MTMLKTALLACLALLPLDQALAQSYAPAEDRPGRYVLVPMAVERPAGEGWVLIRRTDTELVFIRPATKDRHSQVAIASAKVPEKRARTVQELAANVREDLKKNLGESRFEVLDEDIRPDPAVDRKCVRYRQRARDLGARDDAGRPHLIDLHGRACLHPADEGIVLTASLSERGPETRAGADLAEAAERHFAGIEPHAPVRGEGWRALAEQGDANAQVWLARSFLQANKLEEAAAWLGRAADRGHPDAETLLGLAYLTGRAVTRSPEEALKWLRRAAEKNYPKAEGLLGLALVTETQVRNEEEGRRWTRKAATDGDPLGQALLGELLLFGRAGMEKNEAEGALWVRRASEQGDARARFLLAGLLANGIGVAQDPVQARFWLELAASQGHADARKVIEQGRRPPTPSPAPAQAEEK